MQEDFEGNEGLQSEETAHSLPVGWLALFFGLTLIAIIYGALYTPAISGWSQQVEYERSLTP